MSEILETVTENGTYIPFEGAGFFGLVKQEWIHAGNDPAEILKKLGDPTARQCKSGRKVFAVVVENVFIKRYNFRGYWNGFRKLFKVPRPERVLVGAIRLKEFEIPTPEVLITARRNRFHVPYEDFVVTREMSALQLPLDKLAVEFAQGDPYRQFVSGVSALLTKMHAAGIEHGDLSLRNIFCRKSSNGIYSNWGVIDLDGCKIHVEEMPEPRRRRELARLISSFLRCVKASAPKIKLDPDTVINDFTRKYKELSGYNLAGSALDERVGYLTGRIRKDGRR
ncbi:MAG: lipopolysaccharide kinase InaA family protein [Victivallales bacterium]|nr:lipopolysaccharide kinase InaA family protein [Victivallales bacterium]